MNYNIITLRVEGVDSGRIRLVWAANEQNEFGQNESWEPMPYCVSRGLLDQAGEEVRKVLRRLPKDVAGLSDESYKELLLSLEESGEVLCNNIFSAVDGNQTAADEVRRLLADNGPSSDGERADLIIMLSDEQVHVPWGFTLSLPVTGPRSEVRRNVEDMQDFWLTRFRLAIKFQGGSRLKSNPRAGHSVYALHDRMFDQARQELRRRDQELEARLSRLLGESLPATRWRDCRRLWKDIQKEGDSILYVFAHSDGERLLLADEKEDTDYVLPAASFATFFGKDKDTRSASICILNGCLTAAPRASRPWPAPFLSATRGPGFFGFIGTETEVPSDFATSYGIELLWRLRDGQTLGDAFDAVQRCDRLYPMSLLYSCFANRNFRLTAPTVESTIGGE